MQKLATEDKMPLRRARSLFDGNPTFRSLSNYVTRGRLCYLTRKAVHLEAYRGCGGRWITSKQAIERFMRRINGDTE